MQSGSPSFGTPESAVGLLCTGQIARSFGLPWRSGGGLTSSQTDFFTVAEHEIGLAELPAVGESRRLRAVVRISLRRPGLGPAVEDTSLLLTAFGPLLAWGRTSLESLKRNFRWPAVGALTVAILCVVVVLGFRDGQYAEPALIGSFVGVAAGPLVYAIMIRARGGRTGGGGPRSGDRDGAGRRSDFPIERETSAT